METIFRTDDGAEFKNKDEAVDHESKLSIRPEITAWAEAQGFYGKKLKEYERVIFSWECREGRA